MISVILSVFNEMENPYLPRILAQLSADPFFEVICVDGGSSDKTVDYIKTYAVTVLQLPHSTRAARLNLGIGSAKYAHILLYHPRSLISSEGVTFLKQNFEQLHWAAFKHQFDHPHLFLKFISWYSNQVRVKKKQLVYLDHCMLVKKQYLVKHPIPDIAIFEDTALSKLIHANGCTPILLPYGVTTSAIRFLDRGIYKHFILNQWIKCLYHLNYEPSKINCLYERKLNLNQKNDVS